MKRPAILVAIALFLVLGVLSPQGLLFALDDPPHPPAAPAAVAPPADEPGGDMDADISLDVEGGFSFNNADCGPSDEDGPGDEDHGHGPPEKKLLLGMLLVVAISLGVPFLIVLKGGLILLMAAAAPGTTVMGARALDRNRVRCLVIGAVNVAFVLFLAVLAKAAGKGPGVLPILVAGPILILLILVGTASVGEDIGRRLMGERKAHDIHVRRMALGYVVVTLASLVPGIGWFLFLPYYVLLGCGAGFLGFVNRRGATPPPMAAKVEHL